MSDINQRVAAQLMHSAEYQPIAMGAYPPIGEKSLGKANMQAMAQQMVVSDYERGHTDRQKEFAARLQDLNHQRQVLISYLKVKMHTEDWHGVADVAMDLRELDAEKKGLRC